jgi:hypothetical protein
MTKSIQIEAAAKMTAKKGDYVLATKWNDGSPGDPWCIGFYGGCDAEDRPPSTPIDPRHYVVDANGKQFRENGFRRVKKISAERGAFILAHMDEIQRSGAGGRSLWWWVRASMSNKQPRNAGGGDASTSL